MPSLAAFLHTHSLTHLQLSGPWRPVHTKGDGWVMTMDYFIIPPLTGWWGAYTRLPLTSWMEGGQCQREETLPVLMTLLLSWMLNNNARLYVPAGTVFFCHTVKTFILLSSLLSLLLKVFQQGKQRLLSKCGACHKNHFLWSMPTFIKSPIAQVTEM